MQGFGVNTYKWVNAQGDTVLVKYHWLPKQGVKSWTEADAAAVQAQELGVHTRDLYEAIEAGDFPEWELCVQIMSDDEHPELDWDPLDDTKVWPEQDFPVLPVGRMVLDRTVSNFFAENEQIAFGTGVLVDGLDFSDDKMLVGRTFSYSDTQRHRVGPNYLQLPVNQAKNADVATNQRDGAMTYHVDGQGENPSVNYEPSITGGLREADGPAHDAQGPELRGRLTRAQIPRTNDYTQAGERYQLSEDWEKDDLVANLSGLLAQCDRRDPGAHGLAPAAVRRRARPAGRRGHRHRARRRPLAEAAPEPGLGRGRAAAPGQPRGQRAARRLGPDDDPLRPQRAGRHGR